ncbi:packaged DNA stabilization protein [Gilvimarinus chinensis]|uniref:packaged DNA stabilization protein n=1 Tax=Gilvimarinus chinensis TaxID=396005 RepID=UPI000361E79E|nr:packaged DNA stabilization protein [Gilvimarinus chinensis]
MAKRTGRIELPLGGGFFMSRSRQFSAQQCTNWYPNYAEGDALSQVNLYPSPGIEEVFPDAGGGVGRGAWVMNGVPYFVSDTKLYRIDRAFDAGGAESLTRVEIGDIDGNVRVSMASIKNQLVIVVPGGKSYLYTEGGTLDEITDPDFNGPANDVVAVDSYFVFCKTGTNEIFHSQINQGGDYSALDRTAVNQASEVVGLQVYQNQLIALGRNVMVPYRNVGASEFAFDPQPGAVVDSGIAAVHAKSASRGSFVYIGGGENEELGVWVFNGGSPAKISDESIDYLLQNATAEEIQEAYAIRHSQGGADFVAFTVGKRTLVYDFVASGLSGQKVWHERSSRIPVGADKFSIQWRVSSVVQAYNRVFVNDILDGRIGRLDDDVYTEYGINIHRVITTVPFQQAGVRTRVSQIEAYFDAGNDSADRVALSWSDDGGYTWSNPLLRGLGALGEYGRRVTWYRLGSFPRLRVLKFEYTGANPCAFNKLMANAL